MNKIARFVQRKNIRIGANTRQMCSIEPLEAVTAAWKHKFDVHNIEDSEFTIKCIISHVLNIGFASISNYKDLQLSSAQMKQFDRLCECRLARMPIQYIVGSWSFRSLNLRIAPPVFIPRPETEQLVDLVLEGAKDNCKILEVGCGSGAISCALLHELPEAHCIALDSSRLACNLARHNAKQTDVERRLAVVHFKVSDEEILPLAIREEQFDMIASNPPYVKSQDILKLEPEIKLYEDLRALDGGPDGLKIVRVLCRIAEKNLKVGGKMWLEVDCSHASAIREILLERFPSSLKFLHSFNDMYGRERFVAIEKVE